MDYRKNYGMHFGMGGVPPDRERCAASVFDGYRQYKQCPKKANNDPGADGKPTTCGVHSEARVAARRKNQDEKWKAKGIRSILVGDIAAFRRVIGLIERRGLSVTRATLDAVLVELESKR